MIRFSVESDKEKIIELLEICFGYRSDEGAYENIPGRYLLYFIDDKLVAMTGLIYDSEFVSGVEISWTCTHPDYRRKGLMKELFEYITGITDNDIYCSCWKLPEKEKINLYSLMELYNFEPILPGHIKNIYPHKCSTGNTCPHFTGNGCTCSQDLYVRKGCLSRSCT